ncbi:DMT family transporter [Subtercola endophyticus]|uniref:DMT family transporter n=1 Tax=Subtercola endophyticus TaxID=2895559 RepID=UPI001E613DAC|nr:EamA family transporter [Subtercola endophyticus]UFS58997.1 DMT family transporter [Subtercola endophyticus]
MTRAAGRASAVLVVGAAVCFGTTGTAQALGGGGASALSLGAARIVFGGALLALIALVTVLHRRARARPAARRHLGGRAGQPTSTPYAALRMPGSGSSVATSAGEHPLRRPGLRRLGLRRLGLRRLGLRRLGLRRLAPIGLVVVGALGVAAYQPAFFTGTSQNGVAVGTLVALGSAPVLTGVLEWIVLRRAPGRRWALATGVAALGVAALSGVFSGASAITPLGLVASLAAGLSYAVYATSSKALLDRGWAPSVVMGATFGVAALIMTPVLLATDLTWMFTAGGALTVGWLAVITTALAYTLFARGLRGLTASRAATLTLVEPLTATILGVVVLGEQFTVSTIVGLVLLVLGMGILTVTRPRRGVAISPAAGEAL